MLSTTSTAFLLATISCSVAVLQQSDPPVLRRALSPPISQKMSSCCSQNALFKSL